MKQTNSRGKKPRVVIIDGDILVFRISAACEDRTVEVIHNKSKKSRIFKNRTLFKEFLTEKEFEYKAEDYTFKDIQTVNENLSHQYLIQNQLKAINENLWPDETIILLGGKDNFRDILPLPKRYKGNRDKTLKPLLRQECKSLLAGKYKARIVNGHEADDELVILGYEYLAKGYEVILASSDKDSRAYSGLSLYDFTQDSPEIVEIPALGSLWLDDKGKVRGLGFLWGCLQHIVGDSTDFFNPCDLAGVKFGEKTAYELLKDCGTAQEALVVCIQCYQRWYPKQITYADCFGVKQTSTWKDLMSLYFKCSRMKETKEDNIVFYDFAKAYGVDLLDWADELQD